MNNLTILTTFYLIAICCGCRKRETLNLEAKETYYDNVTCVSSEICDYIITAEGNGNKDNITLTVVVNGKAGYTLCDNSTKTIELRDVYFGVKLELEIECCDKLGGCEIFYNVRDSRCRDLPPQGSTGTDPPQGSTGTDPPQGSTGTDPPQGSTGTDPLASSTTTHKTLNTTINFSGTNAPSVFLCMMFLINIFLESYSFAFVSTGFFSSAI